MNSIAKLFLSAPVCIASHVMLKPTRHCLSTSLKCYKKLMFPLSNISWFFQFSTICSTQDNIISIRVQKEDESCAISERKKKKKGLNLYDSSLKWKTSISSQQLPFFLFFFLFFRSHVSAYRSMVLPSNWTSWCTNLFEMKEGLKSTKILNFVLCPHQWYGDFNIPKSKGQDI